MTDIGPREVDVLARTLYGEARGESDQALVAVAHVIVNRARAGGWWGRTIVDVCLAARQFSMWNTGDPNRVAALKADLDDRHFRRCLHAALAVLTGRAVDPTGGADHYHDTSIAPPEWAEGLQPISIGRLRFYRLRGET